MLAADNEVTFDAQPVDVQRKPIRHFYIRVVPPTGAVRVSAPRYATDEAIRQLLAERQQWVRHQQAQIAERQAAYPVTPPAITGSKHLFEGRELTLVINSGPGPVTMQTEGQSLFLQVPSGTSVQGCQQALERMYREALKARLPALIAAWEPVMGVAVAEYRIRKMKRLWGSCNTRARRIWLNLDLIRRAPMCLEFVLVHEMTHLLERGHNARFYRLMDQFMPDWRERRDGLYKRII